MGDINIYKKHFKVRMFIYLFTFKEKMNGHQKTLWVSERKAIFLFEDVTLNSSIFIDLLLARPDLSGPSMALKGRIWASSLE